jgi:VanZ family protein
VFEAKAEVGRLRRKTCPTWRNKSLAKSANGGYKEQLVIFSGSHCDRGPWYAFRWISMALSRRQKVIVILLIVYWPSLFVLAHMPIPELVRRAGVSDKGLHFLAYLILVFLLTSAISPYKKVNWRRPMAWWVLLVVSGYGLMDEVLQKYVGGRTCDATDFLANLAGTLTSLALVSVFDFWTTCVVVTGGGIFILTNLTRVDPADLLPITSTVFYISAYGFFTMLWIRYIQLWRKFEILGRWLVTALAAPVGLLLAAKAGSVVLGRSFGMRDVVLSAAAIAVVVGTVFVVRMLHRRYAKAERLSPADS